MRVRMMLAVSASFALLLCGCNGPRSTAQSLTSDSDFIATVSATSAPLVFTIEVRKTNPRARKQIVARASKVSCVIKDSAGRTLSRDIDYSTRRQDVSVGASVSVLQSRVTVYPKTMRPGTYAAIPDVKIVETGRDAVQSDREDFGTMDVPASNSVRFVIK